MRNKLLVASLLAAMMSLGVVGCVNNNKPSNPSSENPSEQPSEEPSENPSEEPSENPSEEPSENPSEDPSENPSEDPSESSEDPSSEDPSSEDPSETHVYTVSVNNQTALTAEWHVGDASRTLNLTITIDGEEGNATAALNSGELTIESSDPDVVAVQGKNITPVAAGTATIAVSYHDEGLAFNVTVLPKQGAIAKYETEHEGTAEDPFTNEDALKVAKHADYNNEDFYVGGTIASFYHAPGSRNDGAVSWFLTPAQNGGEKFEVYQCFGPNNTPLTDDDVWVGGYAIAHGTFTVYSGQYETNAGAVFVSCEGNKPNPRQTVEKTFAEALAGVKALDDGADTYDYWKVNAYVTKKSGANFFLTATQGETLADAAAEKASAIELYNVTDADALALLTKDANINITMVMKNYHSQVENLLAVTADQIEVVTPGGTWEVIPEPAVETRTLAEFIAGENTKAKAYNVTAEIKAFKNAATKDKYGNMTLTDGANDLIIYGATMTASALAWNNADAYVFTNPQDFMTNADSNALAIGDTITMKLIRCDYNTTIEGQGIITDIVPPTPIEPATLEFDTDDFSLVPGGTKTIVATIGPDGATGDIIWSVEPADSGVEVVDGVVTVDNAAPVGDYAITAVVDGYPAATASVTLTVQAAAIDAESVELDEHSLDFTFPGAVSSAQLTASVLPANTTDTAEWSSSDEGVATVTSTGLVTVVGAGEADITVTYGSVSDTCHVSVAVLHGTVETDPLDADEAYAIAALVAGNNENDGIQYYVEGVITAINAAFNSQYNNISVDLKTSEGNVFRLYRVTCTQSDADHLVVGAHIMVKGNITRYNSTYETASGAALISYDDTAYGLVTISGTATVEEGDTTTLTATAYPAGLAAATFVWESSDESVATVEDGVVTGVAAGTATITVTIQGTTVSASKVVTVTEASGGGAQALDAVLAKGTGKSYDDVTINGLSAVKIGNSSATGTATITLAQAASSVSFYVVGWNGDTVTVNLSATNATLSQTSLSVTSDAAISGTATAFEIDDVSVYLVTIDLTGAQAGEVITLTGGKDAKCRFIVWGATYIAA